MGPVLMLLATLLCFCVTAFAELISRSNMTPIQSDSFAGHFPLLALDGSLNTFSIARVSNIAPVLQDVAWWQADLGGYYIVSQVDVTSSPYPYFANKLENFAVDLHNQSIVTDESPLPKYYFKREVNMLRCAISPADSVVMPSKTYQLLCEETAMLKYVTISKLKSSVVPEYLSLAEVAVYYTVKCQSEVSEYSI